MLIYYMALEFCCALFTALTDTIDLPPISSDTTPQAEVTVAAHLTVVADMEVADMAAVANLPTAAGHRTGDRMVGLTTVVMA